MQRMGLSASELKTYHRALRNPHTRRILVSVCNLEGEVLTNINPVVLDGQVVCDMDAEVSRVLTMTFLDPHHNLNFDSDSPDDGALFADRILRVHYSVRVDDLNRHVSCPVFTGPIVRLDRTADVVSIEAHGMERIALGEMWKPLQVKKGTKKTEAIRLLMGRAGETRFSIPDLASRLPKTRSFNRFQAEWKHARRIARSMDRQLFYPGSGVCTLRNYPRTPVFTFNVDQEVVSDVTITSDIDNLKNTILIVGGKPKGAKRRVRATAIAPKGHPLSPERLGRNGEGRFLVEKRENDNVRSAKEAQRRADRLLEDRLESVIDVTFDSIPIPHLDLGDKARVRTDEGVTTFRLRRFSIPLGTEGAQAMPVGYVRKTYPNRKQIRGGRR